jgi:Domain of unknown function (DUF5655)
MDALERIADDPITAGLFEQLMEQVRLLGPVTQKAGKTSVHVNGVRAFLGVHPRRASLRLNVVTDIRLLSPRIVKQEQVSANRWHNEVVVSTGGDIDTELLGWIEHAYALTDPREVAR